jgi:hypothetical protein
MVYGPRCGLAVKVEDNILYIILSLEKKIRVVVGKSLLWLLFQFQVGLQKTSDV